MDDGLWFSPDVVEGDPQRKGHPPSVLALAFVTNGATAGAVAVFSTFGTLVVDADWVFTTAVVVVDAFDALAKVHIAMGLTSIAVVVGVTARLTLQIGVAHARRSTVGVLDALLTTSVDAERLCGTTVVGDEALLALPQVRRTQRLVCRAVVVDRALDTGSKGRVAHVVVVAVGVVFAGAGTLSLWEADRLGRSTVVGDSAFATPAGEGVADGLACAAVFIGGAFDAQAAAADVGTVAVGGLDASDAESTRAHRRLAAALGWLRAGRAVAGGHGHAAVTGEGRQGDEGKQQRKQAHHDLRPHNADAVNRE